MHAPRTCRSEVRGHRPRHLRGRARPYTASATTTSKGPHPGLNSPQQRQPQQPPAQSRSRPRPGPPLAPAQRAACRRRGTARPQCDSRRMHRRRPACRHRGRPRPPSHPGACLRCCCWALRALRPYPQHPARRPICLRSFRVQRREEGRWCSHLLVPRSLAQAVPLRGECLRWAKVVRMFCQPQYFEAHACHGRHSRP